MRADERLQPARRVFLSYTWEDKAHLDWVDDLASRLLADRIAVMLDQHDAGPGTDFVHFMERGVRDSECVLLICTPAYKAAFDQRSSTGVGEEARHITAGRMRGNGQLVIPVLRRGDWASSVPAAFDNTTGIDLRADPAAPMGYRRLLSALAPFRRTGKLGTTRAQRVAQFWGRNSELDLLRGFVQQNDRDCVCVVVSGIGGVGKTALVRQFYAEHGETLFPDGLIRLDGRRLEDELVRVARDLGWNVAEAPTPEEAKIWVEDVLQARRTLVVVEGVEGEDVNRHLLPFPGGQSRTVLTSRTALVHLRLDVPAESIELALWPAQECRSYLRRFVRGRQHESDEDIENLGRFVQGLPLAMALLSRLLEIKRHLPAARLLERMRSSPFETLDGAAPNPDRGVAATFRASCDGLGAEDKRVLMAVAVSARPTFADPVASIAGQSIAAAESSLERLTGMFLVDVGRDSDRPWQMHDLLRLFVRGQPGREEAEQAHTAWVQAAVRAQEKQPEHRAVGCLLPEIVQAVERFLERQDHAGAHGLLSPAAPWFLARDSKELLGELIVKILSGVPGDSAIAASWTRTLALCFPF